MKYETRKECFICMIYAKRRKYILPYSRKKKQRQRKVHLAEIYRQYGNYVIFIPFRVRLQTRKQDDDDEDDDDDDERRCNSFLISFKSLRWQRRKMKRKTTWITFFFGPSTRVANLECIIISNIPHFFITKLPSSERSSCSAFLINIKTVNIDKLIKFLELTLEEL